MSKTDVDPVEKACWRAQSLSDLGEQRRILSLLWKEHIAEEKFRTNSLDRVEAIVCSLASLERIEGNYLAAVHTLQVLFTHPEIAQMLPDIHALRLSILMEYWLQAGDETQALLVGQSILAMEGVPRKMRSNFLCIHLHLALEPFPSQELASEPLTNFVWNIMQMKDKRLTRRCLPTRTTNGELAASVWHCLYPRANRSLSQAESDQREAYWQSKVDAYLQAHPHALERLRAGKETEDEEQSSRKP